MKIKKLIVCGTLIALLATGCNLLLKKSNKIVRTTQILISTDDESTTIVENLFYDFDIPVDNISGDVSNNLSDNNIFHTNNIDQDNIIIGKVIIDHEYPVNVRTGGSTDYDQIDEVNPGEEFDCIGFYTDSDWYGIILSDNRIGYISNNLALLHLIPDYEQTIGTVVITHEYPVNVRKGGSTDYDQIDEVKPGEEFVCIGISKEKGKSWYRIILHDGRVGYLSNNLVSLYYNPNLAAKR